jgi:hypothetical protein
MVKLFFLKVLRLFKSAAFFFRIFVYFGFILIKNFWHKKTLKEKFFKGLKLFSKEIISP